MEFIRDRADDIQAAIIPQSPAITLTRQGQPYAQLSAGMVLHLLDGNFRLLSPEAAEVVLNDGILNRMRVKITIFRGRNVANDG